MSIASGIIKEEPWIDNSTFIKGFISSALFIGGAVGCLVGGFFSDRFGPKRILIISSAEILICTIITSAFKNIVVLIMFRILAGLGLGAISAVGPVYINEQSSSALRGMICSLLQTSTTFSVMLAYVLNFSFHYVREGWRYETNQPQHCVFDETQSFKRTKYKWGRGEAPCLDIRGCRRTGKLMME
ncbi:MAG: hypothetical protein EZS28_009497 [Streblomastix strix]|uniref:Major facilitator superfamily (MFS) profile domain-containing protein n=1 Tax=Streblomastix strix TaxID=222440 RepID=A0A5J4WJN0_9EUKA|nr:MAG: hypothetical protein EZS28_009497 [Streblomastix strix]